MSETPFCGCFVGAPSPSVVVRHGASLHVYPGIAPPAGVIDLHRRIAGVIGMAPLPLAWLAHAGGRGGFFRGDLVAVGEADVRALAGAVLGGRAPASALAGEAYGAVVRVLLAHEVGHALQARLRLAPLGEGSEREADLTAGWIAESLGWPEADDVLVMAAAGSRAATTHPSSRARVAAYREGRRRRRARTAQLG